MSNLTNSSRRSSISSSRSSISSSKRQSWCNNNIISSFPLSDIEEEDESSFTSKDIPSLSPAQIKKRCSVSSTKSKKCEKEYLELMEINEDHSIDIFLNHPFQLIDYDGIVLESFEGLETAFYDPKNHTDLITKEIILSSQTPKISVSRLSTDLSPAKNIAQDFAFGASLKNEVFSKVQIECFNELEGLRETVLKFKSEPKIQKEQTRDLEIDLEYKARFEYIEQYNESLLESISKANAKIAKINDLHQKVLKLNSAKCDLYQEEIQDLIAFYHTVWRGKISEIPEGKRWRRHAHILLPDGITYKISNHIDIEKYPIAKSLYVKQNLTTGDFELCKGRIFKEKRFEDLWKGFRLHIMQSTAELCEVDKYLRFSEMWLRYLKFCKKLKNIFCYIEFKVSIDEKGFFFKGTAIKKPFKFVLPFSIVVLKRKYKISEFIKEAVMSNFIF